MLTRLAKLASISLVLRGMEKQAIIGVLGTLAGKGALFAAKHPIATLTTAAVAQGAKGNYQQNMQKFREAQGVTQTPLPPGVG